MKLLGLQPWVLSVVMLAFALSWHPAIASHAAAPASNITVANPPGLYDQEKKARAALTGGLDIKIRTFSLGASSMLPTIRKNEIVVAEDNSAYAISYGDIVIFKVPQRGSQDHVKRVIGLPGDTIQLKKGVIYVNGKPIPRRRVADYFDETSEPFPQNDQQYVESSKNGRQYRVIYRDNGKGDYNNTGNYIIPRGQYFVLGDNRDNSLDSRFPLTVDGLGFIPIENIGYIVRWVMRPLPKNIDGDAASLR